MIKLMLLSLFGTLLLTGCNNLSRIVLPVEQGHNYENRHADNYRDYDNQPPAHSKAYGRRAQRSYTYNYYPSAEFYFDRERKMYFYLNASGAWSFSMTLPYRLQSHLQYSHVKIEMEDERPYVKYNDHKKKYKHKKKHQKKGKKKDKYKKKSYKDQKKNKRSKEYKYDDEKYEDRYENDDEEDNRRGRPYYRE